MLTGDKEDYYIMITVSIYQGAIATVNIHAHHSTLIYKGNTNKIKRRNK